MTNKKSSKAHAETAQKTTAKAPSKADTLIALLKRDGGATIEEMTEAAGWQKHSVRGFMAGTLKKRGLIVTSIKSEQGRSYRIADEVQA